MQNKLVVHWRSASKFIEMLRYETNHVDDDNITTTKNDNRTSTYFTTCLNQLLSSVDKTISIFQPNGLVKNGTLFV